MRTYLKKMVHYSLLSEQKLHTAMELYPGKTREEVEHLVVCELKKKLFPGIVLAGILFGMAVLVHNSSREVSGIERPAPGEAEIKKQIWLETEEGQKPLNFIVSAQEYEEEEIEEMHKTAEEYLQTVIIGENESLDYVRKDLYLPETLPGYGSPVSWSSDAPWYVASDGTVTNENLQEAETVVLTAEITYGTECRYFTRQLVVYPKEYTKEELLLKNAETILQQQEEHSRTEQYFFLPETVLGYPLRKEEESGFGISGFLVLMAVVIPVFLYAGYFNKMDTQRKERKEQAENGYTEFITKLSLLMAAGVSVRQAFCRLEEEYKNRRGSEYVLSQELKIAIQELENGYSETIVYENFGRRVGVLSYQRMTSLLTQNVSRGVQGIRALLLQEAKEVMAQDRANIKVRGEQAGTKLLLPMMGLLFLVFAILLVPAFRSF